ncbi:P-II family nitrogen regulator [Campylobacter fetus]|uniref:Nitrogen regulatory protein P-II, GlnB/GlnK n=3 Tax=Campylobacter fetus TaxID=196 RepID=A0AAE6IY93_CAMFE|nr:MULTISPECIES: P-II family nitrogen regulator [Campylobacter]OCS22283.1 transcriptional regulator [Campylobacter fetus subsp. venerealis cfvi97/532]OCS26084.1 transcriptional regulator [Campylobacter fetus subsp. venerealis cfvB10]OCS29405.1 transcriptional regulator [Campylobacter fetus subsp. venerealis LMG 6570 = CCUG 33900]OCS42411.1 transcriptional regulator [Campylobacter fetus subsp. venerealis cfvi02/298]ABK83238.1 nitrogen regulatory protein P-II [Campylobacter fetus subsp. fetus 82
MKLVTAIIRPHKLEDVRSELDKIGVCGITITEIKGYGKQKGHVENYRGTEYLINYIPKLKVEIAVNDHEVKNIVNAIISAAKTGVTGDGKIFVSNLDEVIRIRTNERGEDAI